MARERETAQSEPQLHVEPPEHPQSPFILMDRMCCWCGVGCLGCLVIVAESLTELGW